MLGKKAHFLVDLQLGGQLRRLSRETILVGPYQYEGLIVGEIQWDREIDLFSASADVLSLPLSVVLPFDVAEQVERGFDLLHGIGELSIWVEDTDYEDRVVLLRGRVTDPEYGADGEPFTCSLQSEFFEDRSLVPGPDQLIDETTWPDAAEASIGLAYPFVFGENPSSGSGNVPTSPAYLVDTTVGDETLVLAGHRVEATSVTVWSTTGGTAGATALGVSTMLDGLGNLVSVVGGTGVGLGALAFSADDDFWITWDQGGGGHLNKTEDGPLTGAGDLIEHLLARSTLTYDAGRIAFAKPYLNRFKLQGYIAESVSAWEYITSNLSPILPMSIVTGVDGVFVVPWRYDAMLKDSVDLLNVGYDPTIERDGPVRVDGSIKDIINRFKLKYAISGPTGIATRATILSHTRNADDPKAAENVWCKASHSRYGSRSEEQESTVIYEPIAAGLVVQWYSRARALPSRVVSYLVGYDRAWLDPGNVVTLTDPELHFESQLCMVEAVSQLENDTVRLRLRILEDPSLKFNNSAV
jgi:hypothetical protein